MLRMYIKRKLKLYDNFELLVILYRQPHGHNAAYPSAGLVVVEVHQVPRQQHHNLEHQLRKKNSATECAPGLDRTRIRIWILKQIWNHDGRIRFFFR